MIHAAPADWSSRFIGWKVGELLLGGGHEVTGLDNLNDDYNVCIKQWRLRQLQWRSLMTFRDGVAELVRWYQEQRSWG